MPWDCVTWDSAFFPPLIWLPFLSKNRLEEDRTKDKCCLTLVFIHLLSSFNKKSTRNCFNHVLHWTHGYIINFGPGIIIIFPFLDNCNQYTCVCFTHEFGGEESSKRNKKRLQRAGKKVKGRKRKPEITTPCMKINKVWALIFQAKKLQENPSQGW